MLVDAVTELSIWCNQCSLSMNNSNTWHDTYLTGNGLGKCRSMFLDKISCLLGKCNGPKLFYFLESQNNYFRKLQISILQIISIYPFRKFQIFISFRFANHSKPNFGVIGVFGAIKQHFASSGFTRLALLTDLSRQGLCRGLGRWTKTGLN